MAPSKFSVLLTSLFAIPSLAATLPGPSPSTTIVCKTAYTSSSVSPVPTANSSTTTTKTVTVIVTSFPKTTSTPPATTTTVTTTTSVYATDTTVTASQNTDTATETDVATASTVSTAPTQTITNTITKTSKTTSFTYTTTVAPVSGYTPIQSVASASSSAFGLSKRRRDGMLADRQDSVLGTGVKAVAASSYPKSVACNTRVTSYSSTTVTRTAKKTTITVAPTPTSTETSTSTVTLTSTVTPTDATTTTTVTSTTTLTSTSTPFSIVSTTTTTTQTIVQPTPYYQQCADDNYLYEYNNTNIFDIIQSNNPQAPFYDPTSSVIEIDNLKSALACCVACYKQRGCKGSEWFPNGPNVCFLAITQSCGPMKYGIIQSQTQRQKNNNVTVSSGCGSPYLGWSNDYQG